MSKFAWSAQVKVLFDENNVLEKENKRLLRLYKEENHPESDGKHTHSPSAKVSYFYNLKEKSRALFV